MSLNPDPGHARKLTRKAATADSLVEVVISGETITKCLVTGAWGDIGGNMKRLYVVVIAFLLFCAKFTNASPGIVFATIGIILRFVVVLLPPIKFQSGDNGTLAIYHPLPLRLERTREFCSGSP